MGAKAISINPVILKAMHYALESLGKHLLQTINQINPRQDSSNCTVQNLKVSGCRNTPLMALDQLPSLGEPMSLLLMSSVKEKWKPEPSIYWTDALLLTCKVFLTQLRDITNLLNISGGWKRYLSMHQIQEWLVIKCC